MQPKTVTREKIYDSLKEEILTCAILPEAILVIDSLAKRFEVSRTPVREALLALCNEGLLVTQHHVGFIVPPINPRKIIETYSLRILLEKESARLAAVRMSPRALKELEEFVRKPRSQQGREVHSIVAAASGWSVLAETIEGLLDKSARARALLLLQVENLPEDAPPRVHGHSKIYEAIRSRDAEKAALAMERHLNEARELILRAVAMI
jgi:DNA-binding GntR family transcriptional regulator